MLSKPFKPLKFRQAALTDDAATTEIPPSKRRKLSPPDGQADESDPFILPRYASERPSSGAPRQPLKQITNPASPTQQEEEAGTGGFDSYYSVLWRLPTNKKNKTWTDDGVLAIRGGYATLYNNTGKSIGRIALSSPLLPGSNLTMGGKEVEVDSCIKRTEYLKYVNASTKPAKEKPDTESGSPSSNQQPKLSMQAQMKAHIQKQKTQVPKQAALHPLGGPAFKPPVKETRVLARTSGGTPTPRHDPAAPGALVFKRPPSPPEGRQTVDVVLDPHVAKTLRPHQREGVKFLYECVMGLKDFDGQGCILADEMGLGKTLTTISLLWTLLRQNPVFRDPPVVRKALVVCPVSLIRNWKREFKKWLGRDQLGVMEFEEKRTRLSDFDGRVFQVMIIGYERLRMVADNLAKSHSIDLVICDEGHRLKTMKNKAAQAIESLNTKRRIILSGTPIQNDLGEFFSMVNFVNDGVLGSQKGFIRDYEKPIMRSRQPDATAEEIERGQEASEDMSRTTSPFILRRTADILSDFLPQKTEYVLFCKPTPAQAKIYRNVIRSPMFHSALRSQDTALQMITILKKLCNSPALMDPMSGNDDATPSSSLVALNDMLPDGFSRLYQNSVSSKIRLLDQLLQNIHRTTDEKVVVISNYTSTLNLIEQLAKNSNFESLRLDGSVPAKKRQALVDQFNQSPPAKAFLFLLSARAGGVGLNLIGASRLVLFDVDWNPATDDQAIARIHRQGQKRHCKIYRFLIKGGLEERIWQRQVVKRALADSIMQGGAGAGANSFGPSGRGKGSISTFSQDELRDLFRLDESEGLRTHDLIDCRCEGAGQEAGEERDIVPPLADGDGNEACDDGSLVPVTTSSTPSPTTTPGSSRRPGVAGKEAHTIPPAQSETGHVAEKHELMQYRHINTSLLRQAEDGDDNDDFKANILSAVEDACLEHVLKLDRDMVGGGGVSYVFKKVRGIQGL
ncbi:DNA repair and recombination protein RAD54B [Cladophialophora yegresii CBS 114405]|uniref:DNA repair and recombination protein RAD54B n=1 Tax=Cladophialophora yegresii CBS 114405 TaxID=1182544 RepID=W9W9Q9_9EURO|nr:DNA repair and recombination protein RAD54B [Cladophialophora yegresii CBS 114405]EXJ61740.1 DNA repair and recombination protein RAD54B [Cladophialophora yegresii CBS 114405]